MTNRKQTSQKFDATLAAKIEGHFFASSVAEWRTNDDPAALIKIMQTGGFPFRVWWLPVPADAHYMIENYAPKVEGVAPVASYGFEKYGEA